MKSGPQQGQLSGKNFSTRGFFFSFSIAEGNESHNLATQSACLAYCKCINTDAYTFMHTQINTYLSPCHREVCAHTLSLSVFPARKHQMPVTFIASNLTLVSHFIPQGTSHHTLSERGSSSSSLSHLTLFRNAFLQLPHSFQSCVKRRPSSFRSRFLFYFINFP